MQIDRKRESHTSSDIIVPIFALLTGFLFATMSTVLESVQSSH